MKQKLKLLTLFLLLALCSCEKDPYENTKQTESKTIVRNFSLKELTGKPDLQLFEAINQVKSQNNKAVQGKTVVNLLYGFWYDDQKGMFVKQGVNYSYTFPVHRLISDGKIENIIFASNGIGGYNTYLAKYPFTAQELPNLTAAQLLQKQPLIKDISVGKEGETICVYTYTWEQVGHEHSGTAPGTFDWVLTDTTCYETGGGGSSGSGGEGGSGGTGGTSGGVGGNGGIGGNGNSGGTHSGGYGGHGGVIVTTPVILGGNVDVEIGMSINDIVTNLNEMTNRPEVKERLIELKNQVTTVHSEQGTEFFVDDETTGNPPYIREDLTPNDGFIEFGEVLQNSIIRVHSHDNPAKEGIFSEYDIRNTAVFFKEKNNMMASDAISVTSILTSVLGIHALRVTDPQKAMAFANTGAGTFTAFKARYIRKVQNQAKDDCNCSSNTIGYQQLLLNYLVQFLKEENTGLSLFSATITDGNLSWSQLP